MSDEMTAKELAAWIRKRIGMTGPRKKLPLGAYGTVAVLCTGDDWPYSVMVAMYGIQDARRSGRLPGVVMGKLDALTNWRWCSLIADVATECKVSGEVPRYLIDRFVD